MLFQWICLVGINTVREDGKLMVHVVKLKPCLMIAPISFLTLSLAVHKGTGVNRKSHKSISITLQCVCVCECTLSMKAAEIKCARVHATADSAWMKGGVSVPRVFRCVAWCVCVCAHAFCVLANSRLCLDMIYFLTFIFVPTPFPAWPVTGS